VLAVIAALAGIGLAVAFVALTNDSEPAAPVNSQAPPPSATDGQAPAGQPAPTGTTAPAQPQTQPTQSQPTSSTGQPTQSTGQQTQSTGGQTQSTGTTTGVPTGTTTNGSG
jgi:hypothetical protein